MNVGLCGTGRMGTAIAHRLLDLGYQVSVWNRTAEKARPLLERQRGAVFAPSPTELATNCEVIFSSLTDEAAVDAVYNGAQGVLSGQVAGKVLVEMSTLNPTAVRALSERVRAKRAALVECPVSGTVGPAREGKLLGLAAGEREDYDRVRPILEQLCRRVDYLGTAGAGASMKLAVNLPLVVYWEALGEAMSLCRDARIDPALILEIMMESSGGANALRNRAPKVLSALREGAKPEVGFDIDGMRKDLKTMAEVSGAMGIHLPLVSKVIECYDEAARAGWGNRDASAMAVFRLAQSSGKRAAESDPPSRR